MPRSQLVRGVVSGVVCLAAALPAFAGGFDFPHQSARALGMGDAAVASTADVTAIYYNPGALALVEEKKKVALGATGYWLGASLYQGLPPGPGANTNGEQEHLYTVSPQLFVARPLGTRVMLGVGVFSPFLYSSEWLHPNAFAGRRVSLESDLAAYDVNPTVSWRVTPSIGLGVGVIYRTAYVEHQRRLPLVLDGQLVDVASENVKTSYDAELGWNAGLYLRTGSRLRWGIAYRSQVQVDFDGEGRLTQIPTGNTQVDQLVRASFPFDRDLPIVSSLKFPDSLTAGLALRIGKAATLALDASKTGWSSFEGLAIDFVGQPQLDYAVLENFEDSMSYRAGFAILLPSHWEWRVGYAFDETPQPDAAVSPFLPDADRHTLTLGVGRDWLDMAIAYQSLDDRTVLVNPDGINGRYRTHGWLVSLTISH